MPEKREVGLIHEKYYQLCGTKGGYTIQHGVNDDLQYRGTDFCFPKGTTRKEALAAVSLLNQVRLKWYELGVRRGFGEAAGVLDHFFKDKPMRYT